MRSILPLALLTFASLFTGCAEFGSSRVGLSTRDLAHLQAAAEPPVRYGIAVETTATGTLAVRGAYQTDPRQQCRFHLIRHSTSGSRNPVIPIVINGHLLNASIDTGASFSMITLEAARQAGVPAIGPELIQLPTMTFAGSRHPVLGIAANLLLGDIAVAKVPLGILHRIPGMPLFPENTLATVDVILGQDLLRHFGLVVFDGPSHGLQLAGRTSGVEIPPEQIVDQVPLTLGPGGIPQFSALISGHGPVPVVFDSGGGFGLWIPEDTARELQLADAGTPVELAVVKPIFKPSTSRPARPSSLTAGAFIADALPTHIGMIHGGDHNPAFVLLGNYILKSTTIAIDYRDHTLSFLRPNR